MRQTDNVYHIIHYVEYNVGYIERREYDPRRHNNHRQAIYQTSPSARHHLIDSEPKQILKSILLDRLFKMMKASEGKYVIIVNIYRVLTIQPYSALPI